MNYDALHKQRTANQAAAIAALVDHSWIRNSVRCAFERHFTTGNTRGEPWENTHILHSYGINRYGYLTCDLQPPIVSEGFTSSLGSGVGRNESASYTFDISTQSHETE